MKALALATPVLVLGLLHVLQKLETWTSKESRPVTSGRPVGGSFTSPQTQTRTALARVLRHRDVAGRRPADGGSSDG